MKKINKILAMLLLALFPISCEMIEYHPYDTNLEGEDTNINQKNITKLDTITSTQDTLRFILIGDSQRFYDETRDFVKAVNKRNDIDFILHGGDITDFGMKSEYVWINDMMDDLHVPYITIVGNHDLVGKGGDIYEAMYGDMNFSFIFKRTKFICINTNALEFDYGTDVPDMNFIKQATSDTLADTYDRTIVAMHAEPGGAQFNNNLSEYFNETIKQSKNLQFCLHAHTHTLQQNDFFDDGLIYYGCDDMEGRNYMIFTVTEDSYEYEIIYY
jgi:predicted MPP superfamily phosphohydrolase